MKKLILCLVGLLLCSVCFAGTYISNQVLTLTFDKGSNYNVYLSQIQDNSSKTNFIKFPDATKNLWKISVKKDQDFNGKEIYLTPESASAFNIDRQPKSIIFTWKNVKTPEMKSGFDVVATVKLENENSYWDIEVSSNPDYGIWSVRYPVINDINAENGDELLYPVRANGYLINEFDNPKGILQPTTMPDNPYHYTKQIGYVSPHNMSLEGFTKKIGVKKPVSLYFSPEDPNWSMKHYHVDCRKPNHIDISVMNNPGDMAVAGVGYKQPYSYNLAVVKGDWYNIGKKYRQWGIDNKVSVFGRETLDKREDIPQWLKDNVYWTRWIINSPTGTESMLKTYELMGKVPAATHVYFWNKNEYDTCYPNWLPAKDEFLTDIKKVQQAGIKVMPYTNGHLVDRALSTYYKENGRDELLAVKQDGSFSLESWSKDKGAENAAACINSKYYDLYLNECENIFKELKPDAHYVDQGTASQVLCFNKNHNHKLGGGDEYVKRYRDLIGDLRTNLSEIKGEKVPICTEECAESMPFDMFLRVNDTFAENVNIDLANVVYNGYAVSMSENIEFYGYAHDGDSIAARMATASALVSGTQIGWHFGTYKEYETIPIWFKYMTNCVKARHNAIKFFNFGEAMRKVELKNVPTVDTKWRQWNEWQNGVDCTLPVVYTGTLKYNGKVMLVFTNCSEETVPVEWAGMPSDMGLKIKGFYNISEIYPKVAPKPTALKQCAGKFSLEPLETKLFVIE